MTISLKNKRLLGINGIGRIGKLTLWHFLHNKAFDGFVINTGREVGSDLNDIAHVISTDSTYGTLEKFLFGISGTPDIHIIDEQNGMLEVHGLPVKILRKERNPKDIPWRQEGIRLVIDTTGVFKDPTAPAAHKNGSIRGHLEGGAQKVINSAPFKIKDKTMESPDDSIMLIYGINHSQYESHKHHVISAASCTTTGLAYMMKPLLETKESANMLTASMSTIHAATNTQSVLDSVPKTSSKDLRKNRSILNNIILSSTGAAKALEQVLPAIKQIGFMADSVRIPTNTVSLINLNLTFRETLDSKGNPVISREFLNNLYQKSSEGPLKEMLLVSNNQNVSSDLIGKRAAVIIEGYDTHTRTGFIELPMNLLQNQGIKLNKPVRIPVTHAKLFGWYDNEYGSYVNCLGKLITYVYKLLGS